MSFGKLLDFVYWISNLSFFIRSIPTEAYNALFLTRAFAKHFAGNLTNNEIMQQFEGKKKISPNIVLTCFYTDSDYSYYGARNDISTVALDLEKLTITDQVKSDSRPRAEQLLDALLTILINMDPKFVSFYLYMLIFFSDFLIPFSANYSHYEFYVEVLNTLLALLSTQLHRTKLTESNYFLDLLLQRFRLIFFSFMQLKMQFLTFSI